LARRKAPVYAARGGRPYWQKKRKAKPLPVRGRGFFLRVPSLDDPEKGQLKLEGKLR